MADGDNNCSIFDSVRQDLVKLDRTGMKNICLFFLCCDSIMVVI